jgi:transposase
MAPPRDDIDYLRSRLGADERAQRILHELVECVVKTEERVAGLNQLMFGKSSEKMPSMNHEVRRSLSEKEVTDMAAALAAERGEAEPTEDDVAKATRKIGRKNSEPKRQARRKHQLATLPVVEETRLIDPDDLPEGLTLADFDELGFDICERKEYVRSHIVIVRFRLQKMKCTAQPDIIVQAKAPPSPVKGGAYGASVYAQIVILRFIGGLPLRRISKLWTQQNHPVAPSVIGSMLHQGAALLTPIHRLLIEKVRSSEYVFADETTQPYLVPKKGDTGTGWMWMALSEEAIVYHFAHSRSQAAGRELLGEHIKNLMVDGYSGYDGYGIDGNRGACWSHVRRYFFPLRTHWPEATAILGWISEMYLSDGRAARQKTPESLEQKRRRRKAECVPLANKIFKLAKSLDGLFSPSGAQSKALGYLLNREAELRLVITDPNMPLDNNVSERALRSIAISRRTSLFVGPGENGKSYAILMSIVQTCELHGVNVDSYLIDVLPQLRLLDEQWRPAGEATPQDVLDANMKRLLPDFEALCPRAWLAAQEIVAS